ncbi:hypothetical protein CHH28_16345 [Bacterioplanes sanyensis]|uniref:Lipoprotein n=1 Tax=Bacterioplanes sanyensis TaxID=1249553 RepID=A0A222FM96_9GAMM|nr:hypothetical protein [Bacterioplanes sanyensis]ASP40147.1 hypothetical protein CHH28_16345 [Bacterioplanes sanyensis]
MRATHKTLLLAALLSGCGSDSSSSNSDTSNATVHQDLNNQDIVVLGTVAKAKTWLGSIRFFYLPEPNQAALAIVHPDTTSIADNQASILVRTHQGNSPIALRVTATQHAGPQTTKWSTGVERQLQWVYLPANSATEVVLNVSSANADESPTFAFALLSPERSLLKLSNDEVLLHGERTVTQRCNGGFTGGELPETTISNGMQYIAHFAAESAYLESPTGQRISLQNTASTSFTTTYRVPDFEPAQDIQVTYQYDPNLGTISAEGQSDEFAIDDGQANCVVHFAYNGRVVL